MPSLYDTLAPYYDLSHNSLSDDIPFVLQMAQAAGGPVLELGCGSGRLLLPLARAGVDVTGVDNSAEMLARAEARLAGEPAAVRSRARLLRGDMTAPALPGEPVFALLFFGYNTFMHLDEAGAVAALRHLRPRLRPDGRLLIDVDNPLALAAAADDPDFVLEDTLRDPANGETVRQYTAYESVLGEQAVDVTWVYESGSGDRPPLKAHLRYHYLYPHQYDLLLGLTGYRLAGLGGGYEGEPFDEESERLIVLGEPVQ